MDEQITQPGTLDDPVDEFCYELGFVLRRILNIEEDETDNETDDD